MQDAKSANRWNELAADFHALSGEAPAARRLYADLKSTGDTEHRTKVLLKMEALEKTYGSEQAHNDVVELLIDQNIQPHASLAKVKAG